MKEINIDIGVKVGIFLGLLISVVWVYSLVFGKTFFGKDIIPQYATNNRIAVCQIFQDIRDPDYVEYKNLTFFSKDFETRMYIKRSLVIANMDVNDVFMYYVSEASKHCDVFIDYQNKVIKLSKSLSNNQKIEGDIRVSQDVPVLVEITIRR